MDTLSPMTVTELEKRFQCIQGSEQYRSNLIHHCAEKYLDAEKIALYVVFAFGVSINPHSVDINDYIDALVGDAVEIGDNVKEILEESLQKVIAQSKNH